MTVRRTIAAVPYHQGQTIPDGLQRVILLDYGPNAPPDGLEQVNARWATDPSLARSGLAPLAGVLYYPGQTLPDGLRKLAALIDDADLLLWDPFAGVAVDTGIWTVLDLESKISVGSGLLSFSGGKIVAAVGDPGIYRTATATRVAGLTAELRTRKTATTTAGIYLVLGDGTVVTATTDRDHEVGLGGAGVVTVRELAASASTPFAFLANTWYWLRTVIRVTGAVYYVSTDGLLWYAVWVGLQGSQTPLYVHLANYNSVLDVDHARVYLGVSRPAIVSGAAAVPTLVLGSELMANGSMETGDPPSSWTVQNAATLDGVADERTGGAGIQSMDIVRGTGQEGAVQSRTLVAHAWYLLDTWLKRGTAATDVRVTAYSTLYLLQLVVTATVWTRAIGSFRANQAAVSFYLELVGLATQTGRFDDVSLTRITLSSMLSGGGAAPGKYGVFDALVVVADKYQAGLLCCLDDAGTPANYLHAYVDRSLGRAVLLRVVGGTTTELISASVTYGTTSRIRIVICPGSSGLSNAQVGLYYGTPAAIAQVGTTQTVDLSSGFGDLVRAFDTSGAATVTLEVNV